MGITINESFYIELFDLHFLKKSGLSTLAYYCLHIIHKNWTYYKKFGWIYLSPLANPQMLAYIRYIGVFQVG